MWDTLPASDVHFTINLHHKVTIRMKPEVFPDSTYLAIVSDDTHDDIQKEISRC